MIIYAALFQGKLRLYNETLKIMRMDEEDAEWQNNLVRWCTTVSSSLHLCCDGY